MASFIVFSLLISGTVTPEGRFIRMAADYSMNRRFLRLSWYRL